MTENEIEHIQGRAYRTGEISGIQQMEKIFRQKAGEQFSIGQRKAADITLEFAEWIASKAKEYQSKFDRDYTDKRAIRQTVPEIERGATFRAAGIDKDD